MKFFHRSAAAPATPTPPAPPPDDPAARFAATGVLPNGCHLWAGSPSPVAVMTTPAGLTPLVVRQPDPERPLFTFIEPSIEPIDRERVEAAAVARGEEIMAAVLLLPTEPVVNPNTVPVTPPPVQDDVARQVRDELRANPPGMPIGFTFWMPEG